MQEVTGSSPVSPSSYLLMAPEFTSRHLPADVFQNCGVIAETFDYHVSHVA